MWREFVYSGVKSDLGFLLANGPQPPTPNGVATDHKGEAEEEEDGDDDEWEQVGPKKKATITRVVSHFKDHRCCLPN